MTVGRRVFIGESALTNPEGIAQMRAILAPHGYTVIGVAVRGCLHLKSAVTAIADDMLLINRAWAPAEPFLPFRLLDVDPAEPMGANALRLHDRVVYPTTFSRTRARLEERGVRVVDVDVSEIAKAEGAVTCCSLIVVRRGTVTRSASGRNEGDIQARSPASVRTRRLNCAAVGPQ
jgi:dimethylargininase